ncbi:ATP-binding cassette protein [Cryptosporidium felis]|nr:ATP-binding cassette protein [Cryptosporidium felis]
MTNQAQISRRIYSYTNFQPSDSPGSNGLPKEQSNLSKYPEYPSFFKRGFINTIYFKWLSPIIQKAGSGTQILDEDISQADDDGDIKQEYLHFIRNWKEEFSNPQAYNSIQTSTLKVIFKTFYLRIIFIILHKSAYDIIYMLRPWQIHGVLHWIGDPSGTKSSGILRFLAIVICEVVSGFILQQYFRRSFSLSVMLKGVMNYAISHKLICLPKNVANENVSKCISLFSSESTYLLGTGNTLLAVPSMIFQNFLLLFSLYKFIGVSAFIGYIIIVLSLFINGFLIKLTQSVRLKYVSSMDQRISLSTELVNSFKQIKCYAWEKYYINNITQVRSEEIRYLGIWRFLNQLGYVLATLCVSLSPVISFGSFLYINRSFPVDIIFTSLLIFEALQLTLVLLPSGISSLQKIINCYTRLSEFLLLPEIPPRETIADSKQNELTFIVNEVSFNYPGKDEILTRISFNVSKGHTLGIIGSVGSGKTTLVELLLQELHPTIGSISSKGTVFYCPQTSWIINSSIRDNIILDLPFDREWYDTVINSCCLIYDIKAMPDGDLTEIGENGINISGGQRQRISLARAVYQNPDILILDDVFSALDNVVASSIFQRCILSLLKHKTVILATNKLDLVPHLDHVLFISNKAISYSGPPDDSFFRHPDFQDLLNSMQKVHNQINQIIDDVITIEEIQEIEENPKIQISNTITSIEKKVDDQEERRTGTRTSLLGTHDFSLSPANSASSRRGSRVSLSDLRQKYRRESQVKQFLGRNSVENKRGETEEQEKSLRKLDHSEVKLERVELSIFFDYIRRANLRIFAASMLIIYVCTFSNILSSVWISTWSRKFDDYGILKGLLILTAISILQPIFNLVFRGVTIYMTTTISKVIYNELLEKLSFSKLFFYESIPIGTILSRITSDIVVMDELIPQNLTDLMFCFSRVTIYIGYFIYLDYRFVLVFIPVSYFFNMFRIRALSANRQLKRMFHSRTSPILTSVSYTLDGLPILRCSKYGLYAFINGIETLIDYESAPWRCYCLIQRWLGIHIDMLGAIVVFSLGLFCVIAKGYISVGAIAIAFQCSISLNQLVLWMIRTISETENNFLSYERIFDLMGNIPQEDIRKGLGSHTRDEKEPLLTGSSERDSLIINVEDYGTKFPEKWPSSGNIDFRNVTLRYNPGDPPILDNLSFSIPAGKKIGICGRTGSGKSTLLSAILRLYNIQQGNILIDGFDIYQVSLRKLRSQITIIPQDPNIMTGTLRYNLDPLNEHSLEEINQALVNSNSISFVDSLPDGVNTQMSSISSNISLGQKQLICLARALLRKSKIILLDEATSSMDLATDGTIQSIIRNHFSDCTILSIAHRIHTIIDYDLIIVLEKGKIIEYDSPQALLSNTSSTFYAIANEVNNL